MFNDAQSLEDKGDRDGALKIYRYILSNYFKETDKHVRNIVIESLERRIALVCEKHRHDEEYLLSHVPKQYNALIQKCYESRNKAGAAQGYLDKASFFRHHHDPNRSYETLEKLIDLFSSNDDLEIRKLVEEAYYEKLQLLHSEDEDYALTETEYANFVLERNLNEQDVWLVAEICEHHEKAGRFSEALSLYEGLLDKIDSDQSSELGSYDVLFGKANCFVEQGQHHQAIHVYTDLLLDPKNTDERIAIVILYLGWEFDSIGQHDHALAHFDEVITRFGENKKLDSYVVHALLFKAEHYETKSDSDKTEALKDTALAAYDSAIQRCRDNKELEKSLAQALLAKAEILDERGERVAAIAIYDELIQQHENSTNIEIKQIAEKAIRKKRWLVDPKGKMKEALQYF